MLVSKLIKGRFSQIKQHLRWRQYGEQLEFLVYEPNSTETIIYPVDESATFQQLTQRQLFKDYEFTLPKGIDPALPAQSILTKEDKPISVEVNCRGQKYFLLNRMAEPDQRCLLKALNAQSGLIKAAKSQSHMSEYRRFMSGFYLRLQAQAYLKRKGINAKHEMTNSLKQELIFHLGQINQVQQQSKVANYMQIQQMVSMKVLKTQQKIAQLLSEADKLLVFYKAGAIALSVAHIASFTYMIFFVQWLGWDIIEPLTFSVGSFYSLLGLRFYRKFNQDRNEQSIRYRLQGWVLKPKKRIELRQLKNKLQQQKNELKDIQNKIKIARNRLTLQSSLPADF